MDLVSRAAFTVAFLALATLAVALMVHGAVDLVSAFRAGWEEGGPAILQAGGYFIVAVAVFDVAKYLMEEEVLRGREMRGAAEARRSLTKFVSTIAIAVFLEGLVVVFLTARRSVSDMLYPILLILAGCVLIVSLGIYQRLSAAVEAMAPGDEEKDKK